LRNNEERYLESLLSDFPCDKHLEAAQALTSIATRYTQLEESASDFVLLLRENTDTFPATLLEIAVLLHGYLFKDILSNAGVYRKAKDPGGGFVGFGKDKSRNASQTQFRGSPPSKIEAELRKIFRILSPSDPDPLWTSMELYQKFVHVHPFYDANGRIARFLVMIYLQFHGYYIQWKIIEEKHKDKFLKKLNQCHLRSGSDKYGKYLDFLFKFWKEFVIPIGQLEKS